MFRNLLFFIVVLSQLFILNNSFGASKTEALKKSLTEVKSAVSNAGLIDYESGCSHCNQEVKGPKTHILHSSENDQDIELSVLSESEATKAFNELASRKDIPYGYPKDGCFARAHKMGKLLEDKGIISGKAFIEGALYVDTDEYGTLNWGYHVAPIVMVKKDSEIVPYIFDPSLFSKPVPYKEWKEAMVSPSRGTFEREYFTNRFSYYPDGPPDDDPLPLIHKQYQKADLKDADIYNLKYTKLLAADRAKKAADKRARLIEFKKRSEELQDEIRKGKL